MASQQYRILCEVHGYQYVWSDTLVTTCPIDAADPINDDATCIVGQLRPVIEITPTIPKITSSYLSRAVSIIYDAATHGPLRQVGIFSYADRGATSYTLEIYDRTSLKSLGKSTFTNTDDFALHKLTIEEDIEITPATLEINASVNSSISGKKLNVSQIIFYAG